MRRSPLDLGLCLYVPFKERKDKGRRRRKLKNCLVIVPFNFSVFSVRDIE